MSQAQTYVADLLLYTGTDFSQTFVLEDAMSNSLKDLTGHSACSSIRRYATSSIAASFTVDFASDRTSGKLEITMANTVTSNIKPGKYFYDIVLEDASGIKTRVIEGTVLVKRAVTR